MLSVRKTRAQVGRKSEDGLFVDKHTLQADPELYIDARVCVWRVRIISQRQGLECCYPNKQSRASLQVSSKISGGGQNQKSKQRKGDGRWGFRGGVNVLLKC